METFRILKNRQTLEDYCKTDVNLTTGRIRMDIIDPIRYVPTNKTKMNRIKHLEKKIIKNFNKNKHRIPIWQEEIYKLEGEILGEI